LIKNQSGEWQIKQTLDAIDAEKNYIAFMVIDIELPEGWHITVDPIQRIREAVEAVEKAGLRAVIYTSKYEWQLVTGDTKEFSNLPLWNAKWDHIADLNANWNAYGGWMKRVGKQYWGDTVFGKKDLDVFDPSLFGG
jgi:GH25 family lysozyme M1 (1,4-beta-N-acetylmuramidase)